MKIIERNGEEAHHRHLEQQKQYYAEHKEQQKQYYAENKEQILEQKKNYRSTPIGRANNLANKYKRADKKHNRGECTLTAQWIVDHIFNQPCYYCGVTGYDVIGCDRIDCSKPHTPGNVVPCCMKCNRERNTTEFDKFLHKKLSTGTQLQFNFV